jgi:hypothetical protein
MSSEKLKVLELVSDGKITPEEGVRLIEALGEADRKAGGASRNGSSSGSFGGQKFNPFGFGEVRIPKIDLGQLGEVFVEVKSNIQDLGKKAEQNMRRGRAGRFFDTQDYPISAPRNGDIGRARVRFDMKAGKLRVTAADPGSDDMLNGTVKQSPEEPVVTSEVKDGRLEASVKASLGKAQLRLNPDLQYKLHLSNSAADAKLELTTLNVEEVEIDNNAGSVVVELGDRSDRVAVKIENNAGSVRIAVPAQYALRVTSSGSLSSTNLEKYGLELLDGAAQSGDWNDNPRGVEVKLAQNVASFVLDWQRRDGVSVGYNPAPPSGESSGEGGEWKEEN